MLVTIFLLQKLFLPSLVLVLIAVSYGSVIPRAENFLDDPESVPYFTKNLYHDYFSDRFSHWSTPKIEKREQALRICGAKLTRFIIETCGLVTPVDMKPVKIVEKRKELLLMNKRSQERMQIVKMCCTHRCTASSVRQYVCAKPDEAQQFIDMLNPKRGTDRRRHTLGSAPF